MTDPNKNEAVLANEALVIDPNNNEAVNENDAVVANDAVAAFISKPFICDILAINYFYISYQSLLGLNFIVHQLTSVVLW